MIFKYQKGLNPQQLNKIKQIGEFGANFALHLPYFYEKSFTKFSA